MVKKQLSDEQIDALMRTLVNEAATDESMLSEIADSPATWWGVQRKINEQKAVVVSPWPPVSKILRWLMAGVPVAALLSLSFFIFRQVQTDDGATVAVSPVSTVTQTVPETVAPNIASPPAEQTQTEIDEPYVVKSKPKQATRPIAVKPRKIEPKGILKTDVATATAREEIKTEFIALSYARDPESGQIVRVKVPSSMMVSLGLVVSVEKPSDLVDAEVLVGDDGLSRAIRFIR